ncbi:mitochondrial splicing system protein [Coemansia sp. RSA 2704]|nr:mitochondrial splicing system protein [Coemansia sp. RSA 2704]
MNAIVGRIWTVGVGGRRPLIPLRRLSATSRVQDTIFALSSHPGKAAIAIVRVSGPAAKQVLARMVRAKTVRPRYAHVGKIVHPRSGEVLDRGVSVWFPGPRSYTGEDMLELHVHGGTAVVSSVLAALGAIAQVRMAEAGEFSRRAFDNDKLDLTALEGVADLINAETEAQRRLAVRQAHGELFEMYEGWRAALVRLRAQAEAYIDFAEEEAIEDGVYARVCADAGALASRIRAHLDDGRQGEILRNGVALSIVGPPNSGKSTLLNKLAQRQVAIVSPIAGTTRDIVETTLDIGGYPLVVRDTAGLRDAGADVIEREGIRRAVTAAREADIRICMADALPAAGPEPFWANAEWRALLDLPHTFVVLNKVDTLPPASDIRGAVEAWARARGIGNRVVPLSCASMFGWDALMRLLADDIRQSWAAGAALHMPLTKARHRQHLQQCLRHLDEFARTDEASVVLGAEELRAAGNALARITGKLGLEDVLDALFSQFCIGK